MKFTLNWLRDHLDFKASVTELTKALTNLGIEVEHIADYKQKLEKFSVAFIKSVEPHPNANKLKVCQVETNKGILQIVCGAPNARAGIYTVFAEVGTYIAGTNITLKPAEIRGVLSNGMMLSEMELQISQEHDGIIEFPKGKVGQAAAVALGLDDTVFDVALTPNRGDLLGVRGIAKDLHAAGFGKLKKLDFSAPKTKVKSKVALQVNPKISNKFILQEVHEVTNKPSPAWLANRLKLIGITPRNALVDITNYICIDLNQPMHCYDASKITAATTLTIDFAKNNTSFKALDDNEYKLSTITPLISFGENKACIAGIKGSASTCVDINTKNIYLEAAHFDSAIVTLAKRELGINTDSAYRFERGIDIDNIAIALQKAASLVAEICGGSFYIPTVMEKPTTKTSIQVDLKYLQQLSGIAWEPKLVQSILERLGCKVKYTKEHFQVIPPSHRNDIDDKSVILSEIIRIQGVEHLPQYVKRDTYSLKPMIEPIFLKSLQIKRSLASLGMQETVNMSFIPESLALECGMYLAELVLHNPISQDLAIMRQSIVPSLLQVAKKNIDNSYVNQRLFEVANIYNNSIDFEMAMGFLLCGNSHNKNWQNTEIPFNVWHAKKLILKVIEDIGFNPDNLIIKQEDLPQYFHPAKAAKLMIGKVIVGYFGELHPALLAGHAVEQPLFVGELFIQRLPLHKNKIAKNQVIFSNIMPVIRDFAFVVPKDVKASEIIKVIKATDKKAITAVNIFDVYENEKLGTNKKSVAIKVTLQAQQKTFSDEEIVDICNKIINNMAKTLSASLRKD
ncbi:Phenylalanine--tRNA ligase beta subunit [Candidatus Hepatincola sp. Av]